MKRYPTYHSKGSICIRRESDTIGTQVEISSFEHYNNPGLKFLKFSDKRTFDTHLQSMGLVDHKTFEDFLIDLYQIKKQRSGFRESHASSPEFEEKREPRAYEWH
jgi:hypothetical protein